MNIEVAMYLHGLIHEITTRRILDKLIKQWREDTMQYYVIEATTPLGRQYYSGDDNLSINLGDAFIFPSVATAAEKLDTVVGWCSTMRVRPVDKRYVVSAVHGANLLFHADDAGVSTDISHAKQFIYKDDAEFKANKLRDEQALDFQARAYFQLTGK